jgi:lysozyme family protein
MNSNFEEALRLVLEHEGGFVNDPHDRGGATNKGVTQKVYDAYRQTRARPLQSVKFITADETRAIYKFQYWDRVQGDFLPRGLDYAMFDYAVNSGVGRAAKHLQGVIGVPADGVIGAVTLSAIKSPVATINALCDRRVSFLRNLDTFWRFGKGWTRRVSEVRKHALDMAE